VLTAIAFELTMATGDPHQAGSSDLQDVTNIANFTGRAAQPATVTRPDRQGHPAAVAGHAAYAAVIALMRQAGPGARAILGITPAKGAHADYISLVTLNLPGLRPGQQPVLILNTQRAVPSQPGPLAHLAQLPDHPAALDLYPTHAPPPPAANPPPPGRTPPRPPPAPPPSPKAAPSPAPKDPPRQARARPFCPQP
jgi:hypothetical protein